MDIVNFDALKAQGRIIDPSQVNPEEDYFIIGKYTNHYSTNSQKYTKYPVYAIKAGDVMGGYTPPYKVYTALLTQTDDDAPVATVLENTLGNIVWTRVSDGTYVATSTDLFTLQKTALFVNSVIQDTTVLIPFYQDTTNEIYIETQAPAGVNVDNLLSSNGFGVSIEIRVYN
jgi:hypothetical protein